MKSSSRKFEYPSLHIGSRSASFFLAHLHLYAARTDTLQRKRVRPNPSFKRTRLRRSA